MEQVPLWLYIRHERGILRERTGRQWRRTTLDGSKPARRQLTTKMELVPRRIRVEHFQFANSAFDTASAGPMLIKKLPLADCAR